MVIAKEDIIFPDGSSLAEAGGFKNPAEEDLDMAAFDVKSTTADLNFKVKPGQKIVFSREVDP